MAVRPGEDLAATLFADVHYYYGPPTAKPPHHRFDKGSYVYLFENAGQRRARLEIANNAGTPDQDAFTGHLDSAHVKYSYKHTALVTLTVDGPDGQQRRSPTDAQEWHLPTFDPRNETKYMYRLHTIDIYFWNREDALTFVNGVRRVLPAHQTTIEDEPAAPPSHVDDMSPVVQQLENVAITDPSYQQGRTKTSRTSPPPAINVAFPGPPSSASPQTQAPAAFAPMAYNPAAPAAPEAIRHREKTPPPEDGSGNPLVAAATSDQGQFTSPPQFHQQPSFHGMPSHPMSPPLSVQRQSSYPAMSPPPQVQQQPSFNATSPTQQSNPGYFPGSIPNAASVRSPFSQQFPPQTPSFAPPPTDTSFGGPLHGAPSPSGPPPPAYTSPPLSPQNAPVTQYASFPTSPGIPTHGLPTPGLFSPGFAPQHQMPPVQSPAPGLQPLTSPSAPPGGFSQYSYSAHSTPAPHALATDYSIHQQVYRPTEVEAAKSLKHKPSKNSKTMGKLEENAGRLEKGVTGILKKFEKKYG
ncbi:hypothetical protein CJF32_00004190 [Rutstroemia sp. NJR-2017a WRK4]|nr:hypothetical protein CJF32_00004190 [Rutstroemia sp. NJR-2017a WRK4]